MIESQPKKPLKIRPLKILLLYLLYAAITSVLLFAIPLVKRSDYGEKINPGRFLGQEIGPDQVVLLEDPYLAGLARHDLIVSAQDSIAVAYYSLHRDYSAGALFGALFEAADRGVKVQILLDGFSHGMTGNLRALRYAVAQHENMELKLFEPFNLLRPWTWNNRLHDKYIIADNKLAIIGGRNVGLRYFDPNSKRPVNDRDVLIINQAENQTLGSVINELQDYFNKKWQHRSAKQPRVPLRSQAERLVARGRENAERVIEEVRQMAQIYFKEKINWHALALPTKKITLIHNPLERMTKEPWILMELAALLESAQERILMQSPYFIPTLLMKRYLPKEPLSAETIVLTNHPASPGNVNILATAGYLNKRGNIKQAVDELYEYYNFSSLHAKSFVLDRTLSLVGSFNFDARSSFLSTESMVVIDGPEFAQLLESKVANIIEEGLSEQKMAPLRRITLALVQTLLLPFDFLL